MKNYIVFLTLSFFSGLSIISYSQTPNTLVHYESDSKGVIFPQMSTMEREAINPNGNEKGLIVYDTDQNALMHWNGSQWLKASSPWNQKEELRVISFGTSHNSYGVEIFNAPNDSTFASALYASGNFFGVRGESTGTAGLTAGVSGKGGAYGIHGINTNGIAAIYGVSNGTAKAAIFKGVVDVQGTITSDTLISTDQLLRILPTTINYTCNVDREGMIQYFKTDRKMRACVDTGGGSFGWINLH